MYLLSKKIKNQFYLIKKNIKKKRPFNCDIDLSSFKSVPTIKHV